MKLLLIGAGLIGIRHAHAILAHPNCELVGIVDPNPHASKDLGVRQFSTLAEVDIDVDGAIIATPTSMHKEHAEFTAQKGWHILIEKPVAGTIDDADHIVNITNKYNIKTLVGHHRRYHKALHILKSRNSIRQHWQPCSGLPIVGRSKPDDYFENNWRTGQGSPVMINLVHDIDVLRFLFGEVEQITAIGNSNIRQKPRIESGLVSLRFESGVLGSIAFSDTCPSPWGFEAGTAAENPNIAATHQDMMYICGTKGSLSFPSLTKWHGASDWSQAPSSQKLYCDKTIPLNDQLNHFLDVIQNKAEPMINAQCARNTLKATLEIEEILSADIKH